MSKKDKWSDYPRDEALDALSQGRTIFLEMLEIAKQFDPASQKKYQQSTQKFLKICQFFFQGEVGIGCRFNLQAIGKTAFSSSSSLNQNDIKQIHAEILYRLIYCSLLFKHFNPEFIKISEGFKPTGKFCDQEATMAIRCMNLSFEKFNRNTDESQFNDEMFNLIEFAKSLYFKESWALDWSAMESAKISSKVGLGSIASPPAPKYPGAL